MWANKASDAVVARGGRGIVSRYGMLCIDGGPQPHTPDTRPLMCHNEMFSYLE